MTTKIAIFSDIHANLPALEAVLDDIDQKANEGQIDSVYCLGDLVGYATWPNEVVETIKKRGIPTIAGNYDEGVGLHSDDCGCAYQTEEDQQRGSQSISYTNETVSDNTRRYLRSLPSHLRISLVAPRQRSADPINILMVHGSPRRINEYLFENRPDSSFQRIMNKADADVMLFGHTHKPYHKVLAESVDGVPTRHRHVVNTGSVGKPKDGDSRAGYVILSVDAEVPKTTPTYCTSKIVRVNYDIEKAATAIESSILPNEFAGMLRAGR